MQRDPVTRVTRMTRDGPEDRRFAGDHDPRDHDPVTRMTPIGSERRVTEGSPIDRSVGGSARPPEADRSPAASNASAEAEVISASIEPGIRPASGAEA